MNTPNNSSNKSQPIESLSKIHTIACMQIACMQLAYFEYECMHIHICMHATFILSILHARDMHACNIHTLNMHACMQYACMQYSCFQYCMHAYLHACIFACMHINICMHVYLRACKYLHAYSRMMSLHAADLLHAFGFLIVVSLHLNTSPLFFLSH